MTEKQTEKWLSHIQLCGSHFRLFVSLRFADQILATPVSLAACATAAATAVFTLGSNALGMM